MPTVKTERENVYIHPGTVVYADVGDDEIWTAAIAYSIEAPTLVDPHQAVETIEAKMEHGEEIDDGEKALLLISKEAIELGGDYISIYS